MSQAERQTTVDEQESTFRRLTQRATLAVIARAARRIVPLLVWEDQAEVFYWPVEGALRLAETLAAGGYVTASDASQAEEALRFKALNSEKRLWRDWADSLTKQHVRACAEHMAMATRFASFAAHGLDTCEGTRGEQEQKGVPRAAAIAALESLAAGGPNRHDQLDTLLAAERTLLADGQTSYRRLGEPIDTGPDGPLGELWPHGEPEWYRASFRSLQEQVLPRALPPVAEAAPAKPPPADPEMFLPGPQAASMALHCRDRSGREGVPDLTVTSRHAAPRGRDVSDHLDIVREAIGERLVRLVSGLAVEAALRDKPPEGVLVLTDGKHFTPEVEQRLAERLGLSRGAKEFPEFQALLAADFFRWLNEHPRLRKKMRGEIEGGHFFVRCPVLRRRAAP